MSRKSKTLKIEDVTLISTELDVCTSLDLIADVMGPLAPAGGAWTSGQAANAGEAVGMIAREMVGGTLTKHLITVLSCTTLTAPQLKIDCIDSREKLNQAFAGRQKFLLPAVKLAVEVSLAGFLDGLELIGMKKPNLAQSFADSKTSTDATG